MDHINRRTLNLTQVKMVVLDEADEMLNMGFVDDIREILLKTPSSRQTILFSATMPKEIIEISRTFQKDPQHVKIKNEQLTVDTTKQYYFEVPRGRKTDATYSLLAFYQPQASIIFCNTKKMVDELVSELNARGFLTQGLHGDMKQAQRTQVMNGFKEGKFKVLIATDVAARGIDVNNIEIVLNYDLPQEEDYYVHRIGRTGRAGKDGVSFTLIQGNKQLNQLKYIMRYTKCKIEKKQLPTQEELDNLRINEMVTKITKHMSKKDSSKYFKIIEKMCGTEYSLIDVASAMFAMSLDQNPKLKSFKITETFEEKKSERPKRSSKKKQEYDDTNMVTITINRGKKDRVTPNQVVGAIANESGISSRFLGAIKIGPNQTSIDVLKEHQAKIEKTLKKVKFNNKATEIID